MACISHLIYTVLEDMTPYLNNFPEDQKAHSLCLHADGLVTAKQEICQARDCQAKHMLETAAKTLTMAVALRCLSWLSTLSFDTRTLIEDLSFDGIGLFHSSTVSMLQDLDKSIKTSHTLGASAPQHPLSSRSTYQRL